MEKKSFEFSSLKKLGLNKLVLIVLVGVLLLVIAIPTKENNNSSNILETNAIQIDKGEHDSYTIYIEDKLKNILEKSYGSGTIDVMITVKEGKEDNYSYFSSTTSNMDYYVDGVLVIARVGNNETALAEITQAVSALFNLPVHKVAVIKK